MVETIKFQRPRLIYAISFSPIIILAITVIIIYKTANVEEKFKPLITKKQDSSTVNKSPLIPPNQVTEHNIAENKKYFDGLFNEINGIPSFNNKNFTKEQFRKMLHSYEFKNRIEILSKTQLVTRSDTVEILLQLLFRK